MSELEWRISRTPVAYPDAVAEMEARVAVIRAGRAPELVWLLEHPPLYTAGTSADPADLKDPGRFPVFPTGRGGQFTYHGPGQRVAYTLLDLNRRGRDVRAFVCQLEDWIIDTLAGFGVRGERRAGRVGVWVVRNPGTGDAREEKIAAIGIRVRHWISYHGISLNVAPDLAHYEGIVACGLAGYGVTSLEDLGRPVTMPEVDERLMAGFAKVFGQTARVCA